MTDQLIDRCPGCGGELTAICMVPVVYRITNGDEGQDWEREQVDDDESELEFVSCESCGATYDKPVLNDEGFLVSLDNEE